MLERFLCLCAFVTIAHCSPCRDAGDEYPQEGSKKQNRFGLAQVLLSIFYALCPQAHFFILQLGNQRLKLRIPFVRPASNDGYRSGKALGPAQIDDHIRALDSFGGQDFESRKMNLLHRVIRRQVTNDCLILRNPRYVGPVSLQIGILARQDESPARGFDTLHGQGQILDVRENLVGMPHPAIAFIGNEHPSKGEQTHQQQGQHRKPEREPYLCIQEGLHHIST